MNIRKKWAYLLFTGGLTSSAIWACYWQTTKYFRSSQKWDVITEQLNRGQTVELSDLGESVDPSQFMYVRSDGILSN